MKRTRRIEVVRYTRRISVAEDSSAPTGRRAEELVMYARSEVRPAPEPAVIEVPAQGERVIHHSPRRGLLNRLGAMLWRRGRI